MRSEENKKFVKNKQIREKSKNSENIKIGKSRKLNDKKLSLEKSKKRRKIKFSLESSRKSQTTLNQKKSLSLNKKILKKKK